MKSEVVRLTKLFFRNAWNCVVVLMFEGVKIVPSLVASLGKLVMEIGEKGVGLTQRWMGS